NRVLDISPSAVVGDISQELLANSIASSTLLSAAPLTREFSALKVTTYDPQLYLDQYLSPCSVVGNMESHKANSTNTSSPEFPIKEETANMQPPPMNSNIFGVNFWTDVLATEDPHV